MVGLQEFYNYLATTDYNSFDAIPYWRSYKTGAHRSRTVYEVSLLRLILVNSVQRRSIVYEAK